MTLARRQFAAWCAATLGAAGPLRAQAAAPFAAADLQHAALLRTRGLADTLAWQLVESLVTEVGARPAGSEADARAVEWALAQFKRLGLANVRAEAVPLNAWQRGPLQARLTAPMPRPLVAVALGNSVSTPPEGIEAELAWYPNLAALQADSSDKPRGRIVFIDQITERTRDGSGYGKAVPARLNGAIEAGKRGALAVAIRSIGTELDRFAHTGAMRYDEAVPKLPAIAVSVPDANLITRLQQRGRPPRLQIVLQARRVDATSHNVIAEVPGTDLAQEIVLLGAHLDSWDVGQGAVDDGAGVGIVSAAAKLLLDAGRRPRRTVRVVLFANEENGFDGANAYGARYKDVVHQFVSESDFGAGAPWRFRSRVRDEALPVIAAIAEQLAPLNIAAGDNKGNPGPDAGVLMRKHGWPGIELTQDGTDYFDVHHTENDTLEKLDPKGLPPNVAAWAVTAWLAAQSEQRFGPIPAQP